MSGNYIDKNKAKSKLKTIVLNATFMNKINNENNV